MLYTYIELKKKGYSAYQIDKEVKNGTLYKIDKGLYSTKDTNNELELVSKLYDEAIFTLDSAFYYYGLLKKEPSFFFLATTQKARKILRPSVKQIFMTTRLHKIGLSKMNYKGVTLSIYDLERLLIELVRNKTSIPYETYQEVMDSYRKLLRLLNRSKLITYLHEFKDPKIKERITKELLAFF